MQITIFSRSIFGLHEVEGFFNDTDTVCDLPFAVAALEMIDIPPNRE